MKTSRVLLILFVLANGGATWACPNETVTIGPFHVRTINGTIEPLDGSTNDELTITFTLKKRDTDKTWTVPVHSNGDFLFVVPTGEYEFTIRVEGFLFTIVGKITVDDQGEAEPLAIRPPWC